MSSDLATQSTQLALPADVLAQLAVDAKDAAAKERPAVGRISLKSGVMTYAGQQIAGNKMEAIVLSAVFRNVFYAGRYDPNNIVNPTCFAISVEDGNMVPHENVENPVHPTCDGCPNNEWASDPSGGRGKACKQTRRLVLMPDTAVEKGPKEVKQAELAIMDLPVTSVKNYSGFVNSLAVSAKVPPYAAIAEISVVPDPKTQFKVRFQPMRIIPSIEHLDAVKARLEDAKLIAMTPYDEANTDKPLTPEEEKAAAKKGTSKKF